VRAGVAQLSVVRHRTRTDAEHGAMAIGHGTVSWQCVDREFAGTCVSFLGLQYQSHHVHLGKISTASASA
jgi:hypothetical protein